MKRVSVYKKGKAWDGYTLFCETHQEADYESEPKHKINLINMEGEIVHQWRVQSTVQSYCHLLPDGNLFYPSHDRSENERGNGGLYEIDPDSNIKWYLRCRPDHDFQILENGNLMIHNITESFCPSIGQEMKRHPYIVEIDRNKNIQWEWKGEEHYWELINLLSPSGRQHVFERVKGKYSFDWAHNNTVQIIPPNKTYEKESPDTAVFKPGNIVISYRSLDVIAVIERQTGAIVWAWGPGILDGQHKPHMLSNGNILIFDNGTLRGYSKIIELNPLTEEIVWEYTGTPKESFFSPYISSAQRLENGNTLICEGNKRRLFEVTGNMEIVWEIINPHHEEKAGSIYRCTRYSAEYVKPLLERAANEKA